MTQQQINRAIAEAVGWKPIHRGWMCSKDGGKTSWMFGDDKWEMQKAVRNLSESDSRFGSEVIQDFYPPPNYHGDLNAMHEAEGTLGNFTHDSNRYLMKLEFLCTGKHSPYKATAAHRAEAFLRTLGKWEDGE